MDLIELKRLVAQGESQHLEFKKKANYPEKIAREIVAFANATGGCLVLGVDDDGTVSGTRNIEGEAHVVKAAIENHIRPKLPYQLELIPINAKKGIALFYIEEGPRKPYMLNLDGEKKSYIRMKDESLQASRELREIIRRKQRSRDIHFQYGEKEKQLMQHLEKSGEITLVEFSKLARISKYTAARTLVRLVLANVLDIVPTGTGDLYRLPTEDPSLTMPQSNPGTRYI